MKLATQFACELIDILENYTSSIRSMTSVQSNALKQQYQETHQIDIDSTGLSTQQTRELWFIGIIEDIKEVVDSVREESFFGKVSYRQVKSLYVSILPDLPSDCRNDNINISSVGFRIPYNSKIARLNKGVPVIARGNARVSISHEHITYHIGFSVDKLLEFRTFDELLAD